MENKSKARGQMQPFTKSDVGVIREKLSQTGDTRELALFETAISTMLRGSDLVRLTVAEVTDRDGSILQTVQTQQKKTGQTVFVHLSKTAREALAMHAARHMLSHDAYLFRRKDRAAGTSSEPITTTTYRSMVKRWADLAGYADTRKFSGHSTRRTKASVIYRETRDIEAVRKLLGHRSLAHTAAYLGVGSDEALTLAARIDV